MFAFFAWITLKTVHHLFNGCVYYSRALLELGTKGSMQNEKRWDQIIQARNHMAVTYEEVSLKAREGLAFLLFEIWKERCNKLSQTRNEIINFWYIKLGTNGSFMR